MSTEKTVLPYLTAPLSEDVRGLAQTVKLQALNAIRFDGQVLDRRPDDSITGFNLGFNLGAARLNSSPDIFECSIAISLDCKAKSEPERIVGRMSCTLGLRYQVPDAKVLERLTDEDLLTFAARVAMVHGWPYLREFFQSSASRLGLPRVVLPTLSTDLLKQLEQSHSPDRDVSERR